MAEQTAAGQPEPFEVKGSVGDCSQFINGTYIPTGEKVSGRPAYQNEHGLLMTFCSEAGKWFGAQAFENKGTCAGYFAAIEDGWLPHQINKWTVYADGSWGEQPVSVQVVEIDLQPFEVKGSVGDCSQFINGTYVPTGEKVSGRPAYQNEHGLWMTFCNEAGKWFGAQTFENKGKRAGDFCSIEDGWLPQNINKWKVYADGSWGEQPVSVQVVEIDPQPFEVKGSVGDCSQFINGTYFPTGEKVSGRPAYLNEHGLWMTFCSEAGKWFGAQTFENKGKGTGYFYAIGDGWLPHQINKWTVYADGSWGEQPVSVQLAAKK